MFGVIYEKNCITENYNHGTSASTITLLFLLHVTSGAISSDTTWYDFLLFPSPQSFIN
jgi:hypothetical protein